MTIDHLIVACFLLSLVFPLAYLRSKWTLTAPGRALMFFSIIVASVLGLGAYRAVTSYFAPPWMRVVVYVSIFVGLAVMNYVLLHEQAKDRHLAHREFEEQQR